MVVLEQNHVEEAYTMVHATANLHSLLLKHTHTRSCLTGVENTCLGTGIDKSLLILVCHCGNTAHTLHDIQHKTLCLEQALCLTLHAHHDVARLNLCTVIDIHLYLKSRVKTMEHHLCHLYTCNDTRLLDEELTLTHGISRNTTQGGMITITDILCKTQVNESVGQFFYT